MSAPLSLDSSTQKTSVPRVDKSAYNAKETPEWHDQLSATANAIFPSHFDENTIKERAVLQGKVKTTPESPEAWHSYLCLLNNERKRHAKPETAAHMHATLVALYDRATSIIPLIRVNRHSEIYLDIWLDLASLRAEDAEDAYLAKETLKYMKRECIGLAFPKFWYAWADLEEQLGDHDKAEEHRRKGRTRESGSTSATTAKPPNPVSTRRPLRPPRRANDTPNEKQSQEFKGDLQMNDSSAEMTTPVASMANRWGRVLSSVDRNTQSPSLHNWTPAMRENSSPVVKSTPEQSLVRPTDSGVLDSLTNYYAQKRNTPAPERDNDIMEVSQTKPVENLAASLGRQTPPVRRDVRDIANDSLSTSVTRRTPQDRNVQTQKGGENNYFNLLGRHTPRDPPVHEVHNVQGILSRRQGTYDTTRAPRSTSFQEGIRHEQLSSQRLWNSTTSKTSLVVKSSPTVDSASIPRSREVLSPEVLRSAQTRSDHQPVPTLFSPGEIPMQKEDASPNHMATHNRDGYTSMQKRIAVLSAEQHHPTEPVSVGRKEDSSSSLSIEKRERHVQSEGERMEQSRYSKRKPGTPAPIASNVRVEKAAIQKRESEERSPLVRLSPSHRFAGQSDSSSSATPATDRVRHRRRYPPAQSPRQQTFLTELGRDRYVMVNGKQYVILEMVGKGGSSRVYKVLNEDMRIMALKRVKVQMTSSFMVTLNSYANEIALLKKLRGSPNIVQLYDSEVKTDSGLISLIMEYGDIDLAKRLTATDRKAAINGNFRRLYWNQMLEAVHTIHEARIVHGDLKPANFLIVAGTLKLIDFGIAKAIQTEDTTKIVRDTQQGTPNYMSPEALMAEGEESFDDDNDLVDLSDGRSHKSQYRIGRASDIWSLGCILYQMVYGRTPFAHIKNVLTKLSCIQDPNHEITYRSVDEPLVVEVLKGCLQRDPTKRMSIPELLNHPYLHTGQEQVTNDPAPKDAALQVTGDSRVFVRNVCEVAERSGYYITDLSGGRIPIRNGDRVYERFIDIVSRKVALPQPRGQWENGHSQGKDRSLGSLNRILTPTTSGVTNQASRTGLTGNKTRTVTGTKTGDRYW